MNKKYLTIIVRFFVIAIAFFILYKFSIPFLSQLSAWGESILFTYYSQMPDVNNNSFWQLFLASDHGWPLYSFVLVFTNKYMPLILGMHHQDYMAQYNIWFMLFCYIFLAISIQFHFEKYFKNKLLSIFILLFIVPIIIIIQYVSEGLWWFILDCWFYAYILLPIFPILLYTKLEKLYVFNCKPNLKESVYIIFLMLLTGIGHEFYRGIILLCFPLVFIFNNIFINKNFLFNNYSEINKFLKIYSFIIVVNLFMFYSPISMDWILNRRRQLSDCIQILIPYLNEYFHNVILNNAGWFFLITIISLVGFYLIKDSEEYKKLNIISYSVLLSVLLFNIIIIFGKENIEFSFNHPGEIFLTKLTLLCIILSLSGYIIANVSKIHIKITMLTILLSIVVMYSFLNKKCVDNADFIREETIFRKKIYLIEKLFYLYGKENKIYYFFDNGRCNQMYLNELLFKYDKLENFYEYKIIRVDDDIDKFINLIKEKTDIDTTEEELNNIKFSNIQNAKL